MKISVITQHSVFMPNRPGSLDDLAKRFFEEGVDIIGISSEVRDDSAMVRIALDGEKNSSAVISKAGYASVESKLISVELDDKPGQLHHLTHALAQGGVNITTVYGTALGGRTSRILIAVENIQKALRALETLPA